ncbi:hypothetical protein JH33_05950, partial [Listeria monocytogenes]|nr:hypothetical protein [Listeria monocytogenes]
MENKIFYSWQSSLPNKDNRNFIESCLKKAIKGTNGNLVINYSIDKDTFNEFGSPDIPNTILKKIDNSIFFIADISITENGCPNSNVLLELGYAISVLGWERIICLFNSKYGNVEDLPFDLKFHRISTYHSDDPNDKKRITQILIDTIKNKNIIADGWISNDILSKQKLDKQIVYILNAICRIYNFETYQYEDLLIDNSEESLSNRLVDRKIIGFYVFKKFDNVLDELEILINSTNPFFLRRNIKSTISSLILFIKEFEYFCSERQNPKLFLNTFEVDDDYKVVHGSELNISNKDGYILFEKYDLNQVKVIDFGSIHGIKHVELSTNYIVLNKIFIKRYNYYIFKIITVIKQYLEQF